jgi:hypothetical protein
MAKRLPVMRYQRILRNPLPVMRYQRLRALRGVGTRNAKIYLSDLCDTLRELKIYAPSTVNTKTFFTAEGTEIAEAIR